jgi:Na+/H+ antiporter NhaD/arsenite permease-like protein
MEATPQRRHRTSASELDTEQARAQAQAATNRRATMSYAGVLIFACTYVLISARRLRLLPLDRPAIVFVGAVACVALEVLSPQAALAAIDGSTLLLLFSVMGFGAFLAHDGFFASMESQFVAFAQSPRRLLAAVIWVCGAFSALITNDAMCLLATPIVVRLIEKHELPPLPFLLGLASAANTGSVATLLGNPQNMLCATLGHLAYREFFVLMGPLAVAALAVNHAVIDLSFRRQLIASPPLRSENPIALSRRAWFTLALLGATVIAAFCGYDLAWTLAGGLALRLCFHRQRSEVVWRDIDWSLLLFFAGLFVVVAGFQASGILEAFPAATSWLQSVDSWAESVQRSAAFLIGSNVFSNVPFILVIAPHINALADANAAWQELAMVATFAGNLTMMGSVANLIVAQGSTSVGSFGFWQHLRVGVPITVLTVSLGTVWLILATHLKL